MNCSVLMRASTLSCAMISAPALPSGSLPPVWSPCQCVLMTYLTSLPPAPCGSALSGAYSVSTTTDPSAPVDRPMLPPSPISMKTLPVSFCVWI